MELQHTEHHDIIASVAASMEPQFPPEPEHIDDGRIPFVVVPDGYRVHGLENLGSAPARVRARVTVTDVSSFIGYCNAHKGESTTIYANVDSESALLSILAVIDDNGRESPAWRDHICTYLPKPSVEWARWKKHDLKVMSQADFATWLEDNLSDIASVAGMPTGAEMLAMALAFEATSEKRVKSRINLQNGGTRFEFVDDEDKDTRVSMEVFSRFMLGLPVFDGGASAYQIEARLKYREKDGRVAFWYELIRPDRVFKAAVTEELDAIQAATNLVILNGDPGL